jgi:hypothetical protein
MKLFSKYRLILLALLATLLFAVTFHGIKNPDRTAFIGSFQKSFSDREATLDRFIASQKDKIIHDGDYGSWGNFEVKEEPFLHIFKKDSLVYWNTNQLPVLQYKDVHFPADGLIHLQNGWYYSKVHEQDDYTVVASFLIRNEYAYENDALTNEFEHDLRLPLDVSISLEEQKEFAIYSTSNDFLFSLIPETQQLLSENESLILSLLLLGVIMLWLMTLFQAGQKLPVTGSWVVLLLLLVIRYISLQFNWLDFMSDNLAFQPSLYASNELFPNFFEYLINCAILLFGALYSASLLQKIKKRKTSGYIGLIVILLSFAFWYLLIQLTNGLIENSSIPLLIDRLFELNAYSILAILSIGALYYGFYRLTLTGIKLFFDSNLSTDLFRISDLSTLFQSTAN